MQDQTADKIDPVVLKCLQQLQLPAPDSHKGQNGKLLVIGGSKLFHSSIFWSADVASKIVDMVHFSSPENENNELVRMQLKQQLWTGIVIDWSEVDGYIGEDDCILIGPGMERTPETKTIVDRLLQQHPDKKWVVDGGALQMVNPALLKNTCIITPHEQELKRLAAKITLTEHVSADSLEEELSEAQLDVALDQLLVQKVTILRKGHVDQVYSPSLKTEVSGGNGGMTKGGTGDVLAGLVAALYCATDATSAAVAGSYINKMAGDELYRTVGPFFNAADLVAQVPKTLWQAVKSA